MPSGRATRTRWFGRSSFALNTCDTDRRDVHERDGIAIDEHLDAVAHGDPRRSARAALIERPRLAGERRQTAGRLGFVEGHAPEAT